MKRLFFTFLILLACPTVKAQWVLLDRYPSVGITTYYDPSTLKRSGSILFIWTLDDYKTTQGYADESYRSKKNIVQINCREQTYLHPYFTTHKANMGKSPVLFELKTGLSWMSYVNSSETLRLAQLIC
jgi:hypothetical protein